MKVSYQIKQTVRSVNKNWQEVIFSGYSERVAGLEFLDLNKSHPSEHFELIKIEHKETVLDWTGKK